MTCLKKCPAKRGSHKEMIRRIKDMQEIRHKIEGPYHIEQDTILKGMVTGDLIIDDGVHLDLRGMVTGNLIAKAESYIDIHGMVVGTVINEGAEITIHGIVGGISNTDERAQTQIASSAVVKK